MNEDKTKLQTKEFSEEELSQLLLSPQEMDLRYQELGKDYPYPLVLKFKQNEQTLVYLGARHSYKVKDPQFDRLRTEWEIFLKEVDKSKALVMVEGGKRPPSDSEEEAIQRGGEATWMTLLAFKEGIETMSPEPEDKELLESMLQRGYSKEEIMYDWFAAITTQWHRLESRPEFNHYMQRFLNNYRNNSGWEDFNFSVEYMIAYHDKTHDHTFDPEKCHNCVYTDANPSTNKVSAAQSNVRDIHIVKEIINAWKKGLSLFIVYGSGHIITQEKVLKEILS